jgi:hypothetical protein
MNSRGKASIFRLPPELDTGLKVMAASRGEAVAVVARQLLREGLALRGVIKLDHDLDSAVPPPNSKDFR